jgi:hypothetical protein
MIADTTISQLRAREALYQKRGASRSKLLEYQDLRIRLSDTTSRLQPRQVDLMERMNI